MLDNQTNATGGTVDLSWLSQLAASTYPTTATSWTFPANSIGFRDCSSNYDVTKIETLSVKYNNLESQIHTLESQIDYLMDVLRKILDRYTEEDVISLLDGIKRPKDGTHENNDHNDP